MSVLAFVKTEVDSPLPTCGPLEGRIPTPGGFALVNRGRFLLVMSESGRQNPVRLETASIGYSRGCQRFARPCCELRCKLCGLPKWEVVATVEHTQSSTSPNPSLQNRAKCAIGSEVCPGRHRLTVTIPPETAPLESSKALRIRRLNGWIRHTRNVMAV